MAPMRRLPMIALMAVFSLGLLYSMTHYYSLSSPLALTPTKLDADKPAPYSGPPPASAWTKHLEPKPPVKMGKLRFAIATFITKQESYMWLSLSGKHEYAKRHGYDFHVDYSLGQRDKDKLMWHKMVMLEELTATGKYDWIWWIDFDSLITNTSVTLQSIVESSLAMVHPARRDEIDMFLTADCFPLNAGSMLFRATPRIYPFTKRVWRCSETHPHYNEQTCIMDLVLNNTWHDGDHAFFVPQYTINAFPPEIRCYDKHGKAWEKGMFMVHFPGAWAHLKDQEDPYGFLMRKYAPLIVHE
ncbi:hypothetical protein BJ508DRAFT_129948 [Ascobolus immersus RN42]|uniref:Galactosyl transferase GMA12/MNN10 family protein n=1 Tax=Ascobolus immersus RN42 TaxID=1160509 RepID=A0A3N4I8M4_ASCIM|nr:hypothetical protein BJ508DRAFT_129948 [Ascobolus immersus RN42]